MALSLDLITYRWAAARLVSVDAFVRNSVVLRCTGEEYNLGVNLFVPEGNILIGRAAACWPLDFGFPWLPENAKHQELCHIIPQRVPKECLGTLLTSPLALRGCVALGFLVLDGCVDSQV